MLKHARHIAPILFENRLTELTYFTTDICNMKCRHCFVHDALNRKQPHLTVEEFARMAAFVPAMQRIHLGGGEPFARKDIADVAVCASNDWKAGIVCVPTNGWFTDKIISFMHHFGARGKGPLRLHFSINSPDPEEMDNFTQLKGSFARWRHSIAEALALSPKYPNITVVALATFNEYNQHVFKELIDYLHDDVRVDDFSFQIARTHDGYAPALNLDLFREANRYYFAKWNRQHPILAAFREETRSNSADYFSDPRFQRRCTSGKIRVVMSPNGDIYPCEKLGYPNLAGMASVFMGNIRDFDYDMRPLLASARAQRIYREIVESQCHCDHNIDQSLRLLTNAKFRNDVFKRAARTLVSPRGVAGAAMEASTSRT